MKFDFYRKRRRKKNLKHLKKPDNDVSITPKRKGTRYFEQERLIENNISRKELEEAINQLLEEWTEYGDVTIRIDDRIHILRWETTCNENQYFVKVMRNKADLSTDKEIRLMKESGEINSEHSLVDVVFWKKYRILLFRK